jgi:threonyl-tRNA synthetase
MIRDAQLAKIPWTLVVGDKEVEGKSVSPRKHGEGKQAELPAQTLDAFAALLAKDAEVPY